MTISNPSFETPGANPGEAADWTLASVSDFVETAEFGSMIGCEDFDAGWRLPLGRKLAEELAASETIWASVANNIFTAGETPASDYVAGVIAVVRSGVTPASGSLTVTLTYTNQDGTGSRTATAVMPADTIPGTEFPFTLQDDDVGFQSIENLQTSTATNAVIGVVGSWLCSPLNEEGRFEFETDDLDPFTIETHNYEDFDTGWTVEHGLIDDFDALESEAIGFAEKEYILDDVFVFDNDSGSRSIWHGNAYYGPFAADVLAKLGKDTYPPEFIQHEGSAKNLIDYSEDFTKWTTGNSATVNSNIAIAPNGTLTADRLNLIADANSRIERDFAGTSNGDTVVIGIWAFTESDVKPFRIRIRKRDGTTYAESGELYASPIPKRFHFSADLGTGAATPAMIIRNNAGAHAGSLVIWGAQVEKRSAAVIDFPSSYIPTNGSQVTKNADTLTASFEHVPDDLLDIFGVRLIMPYSSSEYAGSYKQTIWKFYTPTYWVECKIDNSKKISVVTSGATFVESSALTWGREEPLDIWFDPTKGSITLSGFLTGSGTYTGTQWRSHIESNFGGSPNYGTIVWGNTDAGTYPYWGLISRPYRVDPKAIIAETFDLYWNKPRSLVTITNEVDFYSLVDFIDGSVKSTSASAFIITTGVNDRLAFKWWNSGTFGNLNVVLSAGTYSVTQMIAEINTKVGAALNADVGRADSSDFLASVGPNNQIRLTTLYLYKDRPKVDRPMMELLNPVSDSAWPSLGFVTGKLSYRFPNGFLVSLAEFNTTNDTYESFEKEWKDCENGKFTFDLTLTPSDLDQAEFNTTNDKYEDFEKEWTLVL